MSDTPLFVFGYGSLVWRPAFPYVLRRPGYITGWSRRFWQGSTDHRGVPGAPGRVVTLVQADPEARCWGMVYEVEPTVRESVLQALDHREQGGYERHHVVVHLPAHEDAEARRLDDVLIYVAGPHNPDYLGPADPTEMVAQIKASSGPSGHNVEYVHQLASALRALDVHDPHVFDLDALLSAEG